MRLETIKAIVSVAREFEFYGHVVQQLEKVWVSGGHQIPTAAVGKEPGEKLIKLYLNEDYLSKLFQEGLLIKREDKRNQGSLWLRGVIEHEILHIVLNHLEIVFDNQVKGNLAFDCVVNQLIDKQKLHPKWVYPETFGLKRDQSCKWYYDNITDDQVKAYGNVGEAGYHGLWKNCKSKLDSATIRDILKKAKSNTSAGSWGKLSQNLKDYIDLLLEHKASKVSWEKLLRLYFASSEENYIQYSVRKESRRFGTRPGLVKRDKLNLAVIIDTSGSISNDDLKLFANEIYWVWKSGASIKVIESDCVVHKRYKYEGRIDCNILGRGGTNLEPALAEVDGKFDLAVYLTDFYAPKISKKYKIPVVWLLSSKIEKSRFPCDWGKVIRIGE